MTQSNIRPLIDYIGTIEKELVAGNATEHTHRPALKALIEGLALGVTATNEPSRIECGAPDFVVSKGALTVQVHSDGITLVDIDLKAVIPKLLSHLLDKSLVWLKTIKLVDDSCLSLKLWAGCRAATK